MIIYGKQPVLYILENYLEHVEEIILAKKLDAKQFKKISSYNKKIFMTDNKKAQALAKNGNHQGYFVKIKNKQLVYFDDVKHLNSLLILDEVTDIGNIGAIVRNAYSFGIDAVVVSGIKSINLEGVIRSSAGAAMGLPIALMEDTLGMINELKQLGFNLSLADISGTDINEFSFDNEKVAIFLGSEGSGVRAKVKSKIANIFTIKMVRKFDSLNVASTSAIICEKFAK